MKKVLFIINSLGQGGAERVVANMANEMAKDCEVHIITLYPDLPVFTLDERIELHELKFDKKNARGVKGFQELRTRVTNWVQELETSKAFDLITIHLPLAHIVTRKAYFAPRAFFVIHNVFSQMLTPFRGRLLLNFIYKKKNIITVSEGVKEEFEQLFKVKTKSIQAIPNPFDIALIQEKAGEPFQKEQPYILGVGRLEKIKRFDLLVEAFNMSHLKNTHKLILVGEGDEKQNLENLAATLGLKAQVEFAGWQDNPYKWMKNADLMVVTSEYEALPSVIIEALACGTKVVSVDCDHGPREILKNELADFLIKSREPEQIALAMNRAIKNYPEIKSEMIAEFDTKNIANAYLNAKGG